LKSVTHHGPLKVIESQKSFQRQKARWGREQKCKREKAPASVQKDAAEAIVPAIAHCALERVCK